MFFAPVHGFELDDNALMRRIAELGHKSVVEYQRWHGLTPDGVLGPKTRHHMTLKRCALPDVMPLEVGHKACGWNFKDVTISQRVMLQQLTTNEVRDVWNEAISRWNMVCGITIRQIDDFDSSNIWSRSGTIDGGGGVLAWSYLPCDSGPDERMEQLYDDRESWDYPMLLEVATHEIGHAVGIPHLPLGNIMTANAMGYTKLGPQDIAEAVERYGKPDPDDPSTPLPPVGGGFSKMTGEVGGKKYAALFIPLD